MSLSLSSLLNPSPDAETSTSSSPPVPSRKDSLPPIQYVQSPIQHEATSPLSAHLPQQHYAYPPVTESDAVHALAALSSSTAPPPVPTQWYTQPQVSESSIYHRRSNSHEQRPGSSGMQLPPPPPPLNTLDRKMSSPTLDQYHVASRSPDQRRPSMISPPQGDVTLPPIQSFTHSQPAHAQPNSSGHERGQVNALTAAPPVDQSQHVHHAIPPNPYQTQTPQIPPSAPDPSTSPAVVKQEKPPTPGASSPAQQTPVKPPEGDMESTKAIASLKNEHGLRTHSPLRESSVPVQSTEIPTPEPTASKKRPAPSKTKKGTATMKKAPPAKRRKIESKRSVTPSSQASKPPPFNTTSSKGTPANSSPAPTTRSQSAEADDEPYDDDDEGPAGSDDELYCICRKPDNGTFMIGCDGTCDDWFHGKCVGIEERDKNLIDKYICPHCTKAGIGRTTWKRICRRSGCRQPARMGKTKNGKDGSKYCSEECGVAYFRDMVGRTRGREDMAKHRSSRRKSSIINNERPNLDDDLGARGGVIAAGELKSLVNTSKSAEDFKKLGEGVLSPPSTPDSKSPTASKKEQGLDFTESETKALGEISRQKDDARRKHQLLKDRMKFVTMAKQAASRTATEKELKPKEYCGYDSRIEWTESQFAAWRNSKIGKLAFEIETLATESSTKAPTDESEVTAMDLDTDEHLLNAFEICDRKKCARHLEWPKLAVDDVRFEMGDNSDRMRGLDREERELKERVALRGKGASLRGVGRVEVVGLGISLDERAGNDENGGMEVDGTV